MDGSSSPPTTKTPLNPHRHLLIRQNTSTFTHSYLHFLKVFYYFIIFLFPFLTLKKKKTPFLYYYNVPLNCPLISFYKISTLDAVGKRTLRKIWRGRGGGRCFKSNQTISIRLSLVSSLSVQQEYIFYESILETIMSFLFTGGFFQLKGGQGSGNSGVFRRMNSLKPQGEDLRTAVQNQ